MYKTVLVHVDAGDHGNASRLAYAIDLAKDFKARLVGVAASLPLATVEVMMSGGSVLAGGIMTGPTDELSDRFAASQAEFAEATREANIEVQWTTRADFPAAAIADLAAAADVLVIGGGQPQHLGEGYLVPDRGDLIMRAGRPVIAVPDNWQPREYKSAIVAWKNTRESRRALADALPLLTRADKVTLFHVRENDDDDGTVNARGFLERHCLSVETIVTDRRDGDAGAQLIGLASGGKATLVVAGAYGHTRFREWVLGGVTRALLQHSPAVSLYSH